MIILSRSRTFALTMAGAAALGGALVAFHYYGLGLTLSHYDARGHLVVARRIFDSVTPGWQQIGAVWLPLPHLLNAIPVQLDVMYRTGASAVAISIISFAIAVGSIGWLILRLTGAHAAALAGALVFALNPNILYLQATPMTELLLIALSVLGVAMLTNWCASVRTPDLALRPGSTGWIGVVFALASLTRYEAWPITVSALALALLALRRMGLSWRDAIGRTGRIAIYPLAAVVAFAIFSRIVIGRWFVAGGFFVPENAALGRPFEALAQIGWGVRELSGIVLLIAAAVGLVALISKALFDATQSWMVVPLSLAATAALPWFAFVQGHPYRIRYMVPLIAAQAVGIGAIGGSTRRFRPAIAAGLIVLTALELRPLDAQAPMVVEAQWDRPNITVRQQVTDCLRAGYEGDAVMASMGSLGHYMQELAAAGFSLRDFLHEGNGDVWLAALEHPYPYAGWMLIEEKAEGGDMLAAIARENAGFLAGFSRVCEGAGVALYRREPAVRPPAGGSLSFRTSP